MGPGVPAIVVATTVISSLATAYGVYAQQQASKFQSAMAARNAKEAEKAAQDANARGLAEGIKLSLAGGAARGAARARFGASGVVAGSGSPLDVLGDMAMFDELDKQTSQHNFENEGRGFMNQAANIRLQSSADRAAARNQSIGTILTGASSISGNYFSMTK